MFVQVAPQRVRHASGFVVQVASKERVELFELDGSVVSVEVEFGQLTTIWGDSVRKLGSDGGSVTLSSSEQNDFVSKIKAGLEAMGGPCEVA